MVIKAVCLATFLATGFSSGLANAQDGNSDRGRLHAERLCADCHQIGLSPDPWIVLAGPPFAAVAKTKGMTALALGVWLQTSHPTMPNIMLQPDTRADIIAYILALKKKEQ